MKAILVTGAGGFIGHHMVNFLKENGDYVIGVDIKLPEFEDTRADEFHIWDFRRYNLYQRSIVDPLYEKGVKEVYHFAADMGGIGYITESLADIAHNNARINCNVLKMVREIGCKLLFSSSACVYPAYSQDKANIKPLKESQAWPALPEPGYGMEKLFMEEMMGYFRKDHDMDVRIVRFHNVYGPLGTYDGGKEKAPAALCRKVAKAMDGGTITVWGDGEQTRSFMYIEDCIKGIFRLMGSNHTLPINLGRDEMITINDLAKLIIDISGKKLTIINDLNGPQGVRGRNSDNTKLKEILSWEPQTPITVGLVPTYDWIKRQVEDE